MAPIINDAKIDIIANEYTGAKYNAFLLHLRNPTIDMNFFQFEVGNSIAQ